MAEEKKGFLSRGWAEFRDFAFKGNMIDLAIAVVIGGAFSGVINSLVKDIIMPSISYVTTAAQTAAHSAADMAEKTATATGIETKPAATQPSASQAATAPTAPPAAPPPPPPPPPPSDDRAVDFSWTIGRIRIGNFLAELLNFFLIALAVFVTMVKFVGSLTRKMSGPPAATEPTMKECPYCLSSIPIKATKCANCTSDLPST